MVMQGPPGIGLALLLGLSACQTEEIPAPAPAAGSARDPAAAVPEMAPPDLLTRISLDLRGVRPSLAEIAQVQADPGALQELTLAFMEDARFEGRMVDFWAEITLTRADSFFFSASDFGRYDEARFARSVGEEPVRLMARVAAEGRPWTEVVTADWTLADDLLLDIWPLERTGEADAAGWAEARYTDGRPSAGILASNGMWWRYQSTDSNANRKRANQISRILLCNDYLLRPLDFDRNVNLLDSEAVEDAIATDPGCVACHASLDPIASYLFGFWAYNQDSWLENTSYHPERERLWQQATGVAPAWYGVPGSSLVDLGNQIAGDPRFPACLVEQVYGGLLRRDAALLDDDTLTHHREALLAGGLSIKPLIASVIADPRYRAADSAHPALDAVGAVPSKMVTVDQLADQVADLTGFRWTWEGYDLMRSDLYGLRTLAGGADGQSVVRSARSPNATLLLVQERLAEAGALHVLEHDVLAEDPSERRLFTRLDYGERPGGPGEAAMVAQIQDLHLRIFAQEVAADGPEVAANLALWQELMAVSGDPYVAWAGLLSALLRDPEFLLY